jgi:hypothetical protein
MTVRKGNSCTKDSTRNKIQTVVANRLLPPLLVCALAIAITVFSCGARGQVRGSALQESVLPSMPGQTIPLNDTSQCQSLTMSDPRLGLLARACEFALNFRRQLPDFICEQTTTTSHSKATMNAQVTFEKGHEHYSHLTLDGKPLEENSSMVKAMEFISTGELGSNLVDLFRLPRAPEFRFRKKEEFGHTPALLYDFHIPADRNRSWALRDSRGVTVFPEYKGQIWLERKTGQLLRLVFRAVNLPTDFDFRDAVITSDYNYVAIAGAGTFLLPSRSTTKACLQRLSPEDTQCRTNVLVFHDCRKFGVETHIQSDRPQD